MLIEKSALSGRNVDFKDIELLGQKIESFIRVPMSVIRDHKFLRKDLRFML